MSQEDAMYNEIEDLREQVGELSADKDRLEWLFQNGASVLKDPAGYWVAYYDTEPQEGFYPTPREAIDAERGKA